MYPRVLLTVDLLLDGVDGVVAHEVGREGLLRLEAGRPVLGGRLVQLELVHQRAVDRVHHLREG